MACLPNYRGRPPTATNLKPPMVRPDSRFLIVHCILGFSWSSLRIPELVSDSAAVPADSGEVFLRVRTGRLALHLNRCSAVPAAVFTDVDLELLDQAAELCGCLD